MTVLLDGPRFCSVTTITQLAAGGRTFILINSFISCHIHRYVIMFCECDYLYLLIMFRKYQTILKIEIEINESLEIDFRPRAASFFQATCAIKWHLKPQKSSEILL